MRTTIDKAGRIVVPKKLRDRFGLVGGTEVEIDDVGDGLLVAPVEKVASARLVEKDGFLVIEGDGSPFTDDDIRSMIDEMRR